MTGAQLKAFRAKHHLSQAGVGRLLHVTAHTVFRWEADPSRPHHHQMPELAALCLKFMPAGSIAMQRRKR